MRYKKEYIALGLAGATIAALTLSLSSCVSIPKAAKAVTPFDKEKYLGTWYEIARMDFKFERDLDHVTATYSPGDDHTIRVDNKGIALRSKNGRKASARQSWWEISWKGG